MHIIIDKRDTVGRVHTAPVLGLYDPLGQLVQEVCEKYKNNDTILIFLYQYC